MNGRTLMAAMSYAGYGAPLPLSRYEQLAPRCNTALLQAGCTTVPRVAMFLAQIGCESGGLQWSEELADGSAYNWRSDLGNSQYGDGPRFKGRSFVQITGRGHYRNLSLWAYGHGYVPSPSFFVDHPDQLGADRYVFLGAVWYWTVARPMNAYADRRDITGGTYAVNGGYNALADRTYRWNRCLQLGPAILPGPPAPDQPDSGDDMPRIVTDATTKRRYLLIGSKPPIYVTAGGARQFANLWGLGRKFPTVTHAALVRYDNRMRHPQSAVQPKK